MDSARFHLTLLAPGNPPLARNPSLAHLRCCQLSVIRLDYKATGQKEQLWPGQKEVSLPLELPVQGGARTLGRHLCLLATAARTTGLFYMLATSLLVHMYVCMYVCTCMYVWLDISNPTYARMDEWMDGWVGGYVHGRMDGWNVSLAAHFLLLMLAGKQTRVSHCSKTSGSTSRKHTCRRVSQCDPSNSDSDRRKVETVCSLWQSACLTCGTGVLLVGSSLLMFRVSWGLEGSQSKQNRSNDRRGTSQ